jgi:hypothetical protein
MKCALLAIAAAISIPNHAYADEVDFLLRLKWIKVSSKNFELTTDLSEEDGRAMVEDLESFRYFVRNMLGVRVLGNLKPLKILAISRPTAFRSLGLEPTTAGVFSVGKSSYQAIANVERYRAGTSDGNESRHLLLHEYFHFLVRFADDPQRYPTWYDEGMADYWATYKFDGKRIWIGDPRGGLSRSASMLGEASEIIYDSQALFSATSYPKSEVGAGTASPKLRFYAQSFYTISYFNTSQARRASLAKYIQYFNQGYERKRAFELAFGMTYAEFDKVMLAYLKDNVAARMFNVGEGAIVFPKFEMSAEALNRAQTSRVLVDVLPSLIELDAEQKRRLFKTNFQLNPNDPEATVAMLRREYASNPQELLAELIKNHADNPYVLTYQADILRERATLQFLAGIEDWTPPMKEARNLYVKALAKDPLSSLAYAGLGEVYRYMPTTENLNESVIGLDSTSFFDRSGATHAKLADLLIRMNKATEALAAVRSAVAYASNPARSQYLLTLDNLEIVDDLKSMKGKATESGFAFESGAIYTGALSNGKPKGKGTIVRPNASFLEANFVDGLAQGRGKLVTYSGFIYEGDFVDGIANGTARITYPAKYHMTSYDGEVYYAMPHGKGSEINFLGKYEGQFWMRAFHGTGKLTLSKTQAELSGNWVIDSYTWPTENGVSFIGRVNGDGRRDGKGVCRSGADGQTVEFCTFKNGEKVAASASK